MLRFFANKNSNNNPEKIGMSIISTAHLKTFVTLRKQVPWPHFFSLNMPILGPLCCSSCLNNLPHSSLCMTDSLCHSDLYWSSLTIYTYHSTSTLTPFTLYRLNIVWNYVVPLFDYFLLSMDISPSWNRDLAIVSTFVSAAQSSCTMHIC